VPAVDLQIADGNTPRVRLVQDGTDGWRVALVAIQALTAQLEERDRQIDNLERRLEALEKLLQ
jgi:hypothetical protein